MAQDSVKLTTSKATDEPFTLQLNTLKKGLTVDWGDGNPVTVAASAEGLNTVEGNVKGNVITISSNSRITTLICSGNELTHLDVSAAPNLRSLYCQNNALTELELASCALLTDLNCSNNNIEKLKITATSHPQLENIYAANNSMTTTVGSGTTFYLRNECLQHVDVSGNKLFSLTTNNNPNLDVLACANNNIKTLTLTSPAGMSVLMCSENALTRISFSPTSGMPQLRQIFADGNKLATLNLSESTELQYLSVADNELTSVVLPERYTLYAYSCGNNKLNFSSLPSAKYMPEHFSYLPQEEEVDITSHLKKTGNGTLYVLQCPNYSDRNDDAYQLDLRELAWDSGNSKVTFTCFGKNSEDTEYRELVKATNSNKDGDFFPASSTTNYGRTSFLKPLDDVYIEMTSASYPGLTFRTTHFSVLSDPSTGIADAYTGGRQLTVIAGRSSHTLNVSDPKVRIYDSTGRLVWQGHAEAEGKTIRLGEGGIYIINGKKVIF